MPIPLPVIGNTFRIFLHYDTTGVPVPPCGNVIHLTQLGGTPTADDAKVALFAAVNANMWAGMSDVLKYDRVDITPLDGTSATKSFLTGGGGEWTGDTGLDVIPAAAGLVTFKTGVRGRQGRGRFYRPLMCEAICTNGVIDDLAVTHAQTGWEDFAAALGADSPQWQLMVAHYNRSSGGAGAGANPVDNIIVQKDLATQRRRQSRIRFG